MKICGSCKKRKRLTSFHRKGDKHRDKCKDCAKAYHKAHYEANKAKYLQQGKARRDRNRKFVQQYLSEHPCVDCGEDDPVVLDADHIEKKQFTISYGVSAGYGWEKIAQELAKCEIRCANCHRRKTAQAGGWFKARNSNG